MFHAFTPHNKLTTAAAENTIRSEVVTIPTPSQNKATTSLSVLEETDGSDRKLSRGTLSISFRRKKVINTITLQLS